MKLTPEEKKICKKFSRRIGGKVGCSSCPMAIDTTYCICLANIEPKYADEFEEEIETVRRKIQEVSRWM